MRIGIDIDGVLTDFERWLIDTGSKYFSKYNKRVENINKYEIKDIFGVSNEMQDKFWDDTLFEYATREPARKYANEMIKKLKDENIFNYN